MTSPTNTGSLNSYLQLIGVRSLPKRTSPFDPGYDPATTESHLEQSAHLMSVLKISMACWQIAGEAATRKKIAAANRLGVKTCAGGGPFEVAATFGVVEKYLELCKDVGLTRFEAGQGFTHTNLKPAEICRLGEKIGLEVQYEIGEKHTGPMTPAQLKELIEEGKEWLGAGAVELVVEARESAQDVGLFDSTGKFNAAGADELVEALGMSKLMFEAPNKRSQFALLDHFGPEVGLCNIRLEELLRVEIYRRGLHSDAFRRDNLRPLGPKK
ncbi:MAG: phosphosulfolactate synthase [Polyangiaceae bacterium]|nr:phosphosulfolactate synthase [Polyangiaceae bacterium]